MQDEEEQQHLTRQQTATTNSSFASSSTNTAPTGSTTTAAGLFDDEFLESQLNSEIVCGLNNLGNTCYFNSGLQVLANARQFVSALRFCGSTTKRQQDRAVYLRHSSATRRALHRNLVATLRYMESGEKIYASPSTLLKSLAAAAPQFEGYDQQDAAEFMGSLMSTIDDEDSVAMQASEIVNKSVLPTFGVAFQPQEAATAASPFASSSSPSSVSSPSPTRKFPRASLSRFCDVPLKKPADTDFTSFRDAIVYKLMHNVNVENRFLQDKIDALKRKKQRGDDDDEEMKKKDEGDDDDDDGMRSTSFVPPKIFQSPTHDVTKGYQINEICCMECGTISRSIESFHALQLEMPTTKQRLAYLKAQKERRENEKRHREEQLQHSQEETANHGSVTASSVVFASHDGQRIKRRKPKRGFLATLCSCITSIFYTLCCCCGLCSDTSELGELTLEECLGVHYGHIEHLKGTNKYACGVCNRKCAAVKKASLLQLPETLIVNLKRFEYNFYWMSKKSEHVDFPMSLEDFHKLQHQHQQRSYSHPSGDLDAAEEEGEEVRAANDAGEDSDEASQVRLLDVSEMTYCKPMDAFEIFASGVASVPSSVSLDTSSEASPQATTHKRQHHLDVKQLQVPKPLISHYSLTGVVNHHGSYSGGHYTAYVNKGEHGWVLFNDHRVATVRSDDVQNSQAYVLVFRKLTNGEILRSNGRTGGNTNQQQQQQQQQQHEREDEREEEDGRERRPLALPPRFLLRERQRNVLRRRAQLYLVGRTPDDMLQDPLRRSEDENALQKPYLDLIAASNTTNTTKNSKTNKKSGSGSGKDVMYVSRCWLHKLATYSEPGLLLNAACYCLPSQRNRCLAHGVEVSEDSFGSANGARHFHCAAEWYHVAVLKQDFHLFCLMFGGGNWDEKNQQQEGAGSSSSVMVDEEEMFEMKKRESLWMAALLHAQQGRQ